MTTFTPCSPQMVLIPGGVFNGNPIEPFCLGKNPVTNAEYAAHADRYQEKPFVLMDIPLEISKASIVTRGENPMEILCREPLKTLTISGSAIKRLMSGNIQNPLILGSYILFELEKYPSPKGFDRPNQPVVNVSWFHAFEYCLSNGLFLPSDDQWEYAARGPEGHKFGTRSGKLTREEAHYKSGVTTDVGSYPPNGFGLQDMTGNVLEWTARNPTQGYPYGLRGGSWDNVDPDDLRAACRYDYDPDGRGHGIGFRVGSHPSGRVS